MRTKSVLYIFFLIFSLSVKAQLTQITVAKNNNAAIEKTIRQEKNFGHDSIALKAYLQPLAESNDEINSILYQALLANGFAKYFDGFNERSHAAYLLSVEKAKKTKHTGLEIWTQLNYTAYLYYFRDVTAALPVFMSAINDINRTTPQKMIFPGESFKKIGFFMGTIGDNAEAINYLEKALQYTKPNTTEYASILDNTGQYYFHAGDNKNAAQYFGKASQMAMQIKDYVRYGKALGNMALIHQKNGDYKTAIRLVEEDIKYSELYKSDQNTMYALTLLGRLFLENGNVAEAQKALDKAETIAISKSYFQASEQDIVRLKLDIFKKLNKPAEELIARRRLAELEDSLKKTDGDLPLRKANWMVQKTKYVQEIEKTNAQYVQQATLKTFYAIIAGLAIALAVLLYMNTQRRLKNRQDSYDKMVMSFELEKLKFEQKLSKAHEDIHAQIDFLKEKNQQIKQLHTEIERIKASPSFYIEEEKGKLHELLESHLITEENWTNFKREFKREYPHWYQELLTGFPELTESNLRIVLLIKLGFNNNEISDLLGITADAVKKSKQRMKKKLGEKSEVLFDIIAHS